MWPQKRRFSERFQTVPEEGMRYQFQRQRQQTRDEADVWNIGRPAGNHSALSRVIFSRPAQRKTNHGTRRIFDINTDCRKAVSNENNENYMLSEDGLGRNENQFFNWNPKTFGHCDDLNSFKENHWTESPLKEITMNRGEPHLQNVYQNTPQPFAGVPVFGGRHVTTRKQKNPDSFYYNEDDCSQQNSASLEDTPLTPSTFSKDSSFSDILSNLSSENHYRYHKFSGSSTDRSEEPFITSKSCYNNSSPPANETQSCNDCIGHLAKRIKEEPEYQSFLETPESREERMSPVTEGLYKTMSILKKEFTDFSDHVFHSPEQVSSPAKFDFFSFPDKVSSPNFRLTSQPGRQRSQYFQFEPYITDPDEEYEKNVRTHAVPVSSSQKFSIFLS